MTTRYDCALNGIALSSLSAAIHVTDVTELPPVQRVAAVPTARHGLKLLRRVRERLTLHVSFIIHEYDPAARRSVLQSVYAWAEQGGLLTVSDRPSQQLQVECDTLPGMSALGWLDEMTLSFTAWETPFWEAALRTAVTTGDNATLLLPGTADDVPVSCAVVNLGDGPLTALTLAVGDTAITLEDMAVAPGGSVEVIADAGPLQIRSGSASLMHLRTGASHDLLTADSSVETAVTVTADQPVSAVFSARGRYL